MLGAEGVINISKTLFFYLKELGMKQITNVEKLT